ncbi:Hypothetical predicted protein [Podarcis lilfordi]|uniref:Uncharacterized protein n=1 Tax=Podarcis lilfordi TaxID=74358 RepID=A0AA35JWN4_9SAUR|nr:Hypothetical predicted protein [Podarcis lilfordi]
MASLVLKISQISYPPVPLGLEQAENGAHLRGSGMPVTWRSSIMVSQESKAFYMWLLLV